MHANFENEENFEALLIAGFENVPATPLRPDEDDFDAGHRVVNILANDLALDLVTLNLDTDD